MEWKFVLSQMLKAHLNKVPEHDTANGSLLFFSNIQHASVYMWKLDMYICTSRTESDVEN